MNRSNGSLTVCRFCGNEFDPNHVYHRLGYIDQCGDCADERPEDLVMALEEPPSNKMPCEVLPIHRDAIKGEVRRYVFFNQRYQTIGPKKG